MLKKTLDILGYQIIKKNHRSKVQDLTMFTYGELIYASCEYDEIPLFFVSPDIIMNERCFGYSKHGWHPFTALLKQYQENRALQYEGSIVQKFYDNFTPSNLGQAILHNNSTSYVELSKYSALDKLMPWSLLPRIYDGECGLDPKHGCQSQGPVSAKKGKMEFSRVIRTFNSIESKGFQYQSYNQINEHLRGYFLKKGDEWRFIIISGNHRVAALVELGFTEIPVTFQPTFPRVIDFKDRLTWPQVLNGTLSLKAAEDVFGAFFDGFGEVKAKHLGLIE